MKEIAPQQRDNLRTPKEMSTGSELDGDQMPKVHRARRVGTRSRGDGRYKPKLGLIGSRWRRRDRRGE
jgi:hypothetical protein